MNEHIIEITNVSKSFGGHAALRSVNLQVERGEFLTLLGPSGCGKTTLLRLIAGLDSPSSGKILLNGEDMTFLPAEKRPINTVFQSYALFPHMSVFDNVAFGPKVKGLSRKEVEARVMEALAMVSLEEYAKRKPGQLSGGQQQRVAIARAIVNKPLVLLLDEPLNALDYNLRKAMQLELRQFQRQLGITFIFVTHDQEEALSMSNRIVVMNDGKIEQSGAPKEVYKFPRNLFVAKFLGETNILEGKVRNTNSHRLDLSLEGMPVSVYKPSENHGRLQPGSRVNVLIRPEDLRIWRRDELQDGTELFSATVEEVIYKGATVDLVLRLTTGRLLSASRFLNEKNDGAVFLMGEQVFLDWASGREVILPHET